MFELDTKPICLLVNNSTIQEIDRTNDRNQNHVNVGKTTPTRSHEGVKNYTQEDELNLMDSGSSDQCESLRFYILCSHFFLHKLSKKEIKNNTNPSIPKKEIIQS